MTVISLMLVSFSSWFVGTLAGGGSNLVLMPLINSILGAQAVPPIVTTGTMLGNSHRVFLFSQDVDWPAIQWFFPRAGAGAFLGAYVFTHAHLQGLQILMGLFLLATVFSSGFGKQERSFTVHSWYFLPTGFLFAFISGITGGTGPLLNTFYLNYGLNRNQMIATKAANLLIVNLTKMVIYAVFGALTMQYIWYGLLIGIAAAPANWLGQLALSKVNDELFKQVVLGFTAINAVFMLWDRQQLFVFWQFLSMLPQMLAQ